MFSLVIVLLVGNPDRSNKQRIPSGTFRSSWSSLNNSNVCQALHHHFSPLITWLISRWFPLQRVTPTGTVGVRAGYGERRLGMGRGDWVKVTGPGEVHIGEVVEGNRRSTYSAE